MLFVQRLDVARFVHRLPNRDHLYLLTSEPREGRSLLLDPKHNNDARLKAEERFEPHSKRYQDLAKLAITLSAAALTFLVSVTFNEKPMNPPFAVRIQAVTPIIAGFLLDHCTYYGVDASSRHLTIKPTAIPSPAPTSRGDALSLALGFAGLIAFVLGFLWLAHTCFDESRRHLGGWPILARFPERVGSRCSLRLSPLSHAPS